MGILAVLGSLYALYLGFEFDRKVSRTLGKSRAGFKPSVCLVMPCKGDEPGLERNIEAALKQEYENYRTAIVTDTAQDPAYAVARSVLARHPAANAELYTSGPLTGASGKVTALLTALERNKGQADIFAFLDSDALVSPNWLRELVDPLIDESVGATTGFRWYFSSEGGVWSHVEAAWNAAGTSLLFDDRYNFPWGGAMAVRSETLEKLEIKKVWGNAISDDMTLNSALRSRNYKTIFLPQCTVATFSRATLPHLLEWATRQTVLTKVLNRGLWNYALIAYVLFDFAFLLGVLGDALGIYLGPSWFLPAAFLLTPTLIGFVRSSQRNGTFKRALPHLKPEFEKNSLADAMASFIVPWIMTYCIIRSALTREIEWRGRRYELKEMNTLAPP